MTSYTLRNEPKKSDFVLFRACHAAKCGRTAQVRYGYLIERGAIEWIK